MTVIEFKPKAKTEPVTPNSLDYFRDVIESGLEFDCYNEKEVMISYSGFTFWWLINGEMIMGRLDSSDFYLPISKQEIEVFGLTHTTATSTIIRFCKRILKECYAAKNT